MKKGIWIVFLLLGIWACRKERHPKPEEVFSGFRRPLNFPEPVYALDRNPVTAAGFELGKKLFYDGLLSRDHTVSCASCHIQSAAFTQHGHDVSHGIDDRLGIRNSPPIMNLAWNSAFMWGGGVYDLDLQPIVPITAHEEMDETLENVLQKLQGQVSYRELFHKAFGTTEITTVHLMKALSQFMLMCVSSDSKYDQVMNRKPGVSFTAEEQAGYLIFQQKCASCHSEPLFTDGTFRNNGLAAGPVNDQGLFEATLKETDRYRFKVPSLRNLRYTAPYMHDGRFLSLNAVLEHYHSQVRDTPNLDPLLAGARKGLVLSSDERTVLLAFLGTLNDPGFISNPLLAEY